ncbi:MAG: amino acid permease [Rhodopirellula sp.]|nr:amino acid permease [Rhodopirellula sp.]
MTDIQTGEPGSDAGGNDLPASLSLWDAVRIIVGIVVGVSIFKVPGLIFSNVSSPLEGLMAWGFGAVVALCGALTYAELATLHRRSGGEYVYLSRAFGPWLGFLFGWAQLTGVFSGSIGTMAYVFSDYAVVLFNWDKSAGVGLALLAVVLLTTLHILGVKIGKTVQNLLTLSKLVGLVMLLGVGLLAESHDSLTTEIPAGGGGFGLAMVFILYAYGGWNDAAMVSTEIRDSKRNVPRSLLIGIGLISCIYLLLNLAYLRGLGFAALRESGTPATEVIAQSQLLSPTVRGLSVQVIAVLVMLSALGAVHGLIFTGSRLYAALGSDHGLFEKLGHWHPRLGSPVWSLIAQAALTSLLILTVGTQTGRDAVNAVVTTVGRKPVPWNNFGGGFDTLLAATAPVFWSFFLLSGATVFVFRIREPQADRPFRTPLFPLVPLVFVLSSVYMIYSSITYAGDLALLALIPLAAGIPVYLLSSHTTNSTTQSP